MRGCDHDVEFGFIQSRDDVRYGCRIVVKVQTITGENVLGWILLQIDD